VHSLFLSTEYFVLRRQPPASRFSLLFRFSLFAACQPPTPPVPLAPAHWVDARGEQPRLVAVVVVEVLPSPKILPPTAVNHQKHPGFGRFSPSPFERRFDFFLNRSVELKTRDLMA
jgi:hypothetical protein